MGKHCHLSNEEVVEIASSQIESIRTVISKTNDVVLNKNLSHQDMNLLLSNKKEMLGKIDALTEIIVKLKLNEFNSLFEHI